MKYLFQYFKLNGFTMTMGNVIIERPQITVEQLESLLPSEVQEIDGQIIERL